jgi:hypothetical protein
MSHSLEKQGRDKIVFANIEIMYTSLDYEMCQYHPFLPTSHLYNIQDAPGTEKPDEDACDVVSRFQN